jgi:DNA-binding NtrC family response regulator
VPTDKPLLDRDAPPRGGASTGSLILLVDDNPTNLQVLYQTLDGHGYRLLAARSGKDALSIAERAVPDLVLLDVMMPEMDGFETCARLKAGERTRDAAVVFLSAITDGREKVRGLDLGAVDFVNKPFQAEEVLARVRTHLRIRDLERQLRRRNDELQHELHVAQELLRDARDRTDGALLGDSPSAERLRRDIAAAAQDDGALLISGPPGSDHEAIARAVHHQSSRRARAIICVNCVAASESANEDTGSALDLTAKLRLAEGGTLYLEGIQHLSSAWQRQIAGVLRGPSSARAESAAAFDVRVVGAVTRDLDEELAAGRILPDLHRAFRRTLDVPPLRARVEDLPVLARHFVRRQAERAGRPVPHIADETLERLQRYRWPGNLAELRSVLERASGLSDGERLDVGDHLLDDSVRIGSYQLVDRIGAGGMGEVWLARHQLLARPAAVKIIRDAALTGDSDERRVVRQRFEREAHATASLQSPHTVQLYDFGTTDTGSFYYVMERLRGMDLQRLVDRHGPLPASRVVFLMKQACRSLAEAHAQGLVHRDIKPANLFVCHLGMQYDFLKVLDFGVVARRARERMQPVTTAGDVLGTPAFLAPELATSERSFDGRADIYALGCVAFFLLTGRLPFDGKDALSLLMHHARTVPERPSAFAEEPIPPALDAAVLACLAKEPSSRPRTADMLREQLEAIAMPAAWSERDARSWWESHEPDLIAGAV